MTFSNKASVNFSGGEVSLKIYARTDIPLFAKVLARLQNFIAEPQGPARYRPGTVYVHHTRNNNKAILIPFQFNDIQSYLIEATDQHFRFYKNGGIILENPVTITGISQASPGVVTAPAHGYAVGREVYFSGIVGMTQLNGKYAVISSVTTNTFTITNEFGAAIDTTAYSAYISGGTSAAIFEMVTPYREADLETLQYSQSADTMYIVHQNYEQRKLTRTTDISWTLARYARTADPFVTAVAVSGITKANPGVVTATAHGRANGDLVYIDSVAGMTQINNTHFKVNNVTANTYELQTPAGVNVDTTGYSAYTSGGFSEQIQGRDYPRAVTFTDDARLAVGGTLNHPETFWFSKGPSAAGAVRFDDYTTGTNATDAVIFTLAPVHGKVDSIRWLSNTDKFIVAGTFGTVRRIYGATEAEPISPTSITAKSVNAYGAATCSPVTNGSTIFYIQRGGQLVRSFEYDYLTDGYVSTDRNLVADHITVGGLKQMVSQLGRPDIIWVVRNDGILLGLTYKDKENISGWHRHIIANGLARWVGILPRENDQEQLWLVVERTINGQTVRFIEYISDPPDFPDPTDFFSTSSPESEIADVERFYNYQSEVAKHAIHLDAVSTYDGSAYGTNANASVTVSMDADIADATGQVFTTDQAVFTSDMVGRQIWGAYTSEGIGGGRALITGYNSSTSVTCTILDTFMPTATYPPGQWFLTATTISNLDYLEGETVGFIADGAVPPTDIVQNGTITIAEPASVIHVGLGYTGIIKTLPLDQGGVTGPAQSKLKIVAKAALRFVNSAGVLFGTTLYNLSELSFRRGNDPTGRPVPLFTGVEDQFAEDSWSEDKTVLVLQEDPLPCIVSGLDIYMDTSDE